MESLDFVPDVRDGLTAVERALLRAAQPATAGYTKARPVVDEACRVVPGHGHRLVYDALVRMCGHQARYPLFDGVGNFGSIDDDPPADSQFTEVRRSRLGDALVGQPPAAAAEVMRGGFPAGLANGHWEGLGVIPPHHLGELVAAIKLRLEDPTTGLDDVLAVMPGPDFPGGGLCPFPEQIRAAYATGRGSLTVRATAHLERAGERNRDLTDAVTAAEPPPPRGRRARVEEWPSVIGGAIVITDVPPLASKGGDDGIISQVADAIADGRIEAFDVNDRSDRRGAEIVVELRRDAAPVQTMAALYAITDLEVHLPVQLVAIGPGGGPRSHSLLELIDAYISHQRAIVSAEGLTTSAAADRTIASRLVAATEQSIDRRCTAIGNLGCR